MSHPLFLQGQAVFLILRTPALEAVTDSEDNLRFQRRPLAYLTRLPPCLCRKSALGPERSEPVRHASRACIISSHREERFALFAADGGKDLRWSGLGLLKESLKEAVRDCFDRRPPTRLGVGRIGVRGLVEAVCNKRNPS